MYYTEQNERREKMTFNKLDEIRRAKSISREKLASMVDVSAKTIENWEKNPETIPIGKAKALCNAMGIEWRVDIFL